MTLIHILGLLLLVLAAASTWLCRRTTTVHGSLLVWLTYVASLFGSAALLLP